MQPLLEMHLIIIGILNIKRMFLEKFSMMKLKSEKAYQKSQAYLRETTRFALIRSTVSLLVTVVFLISGGFEWVDAGVRELSNRSIVQGILFIGALIVLSRILGLPFSIYSVFVIEEKFGFNRMTWKTFISDRLKGALNTPRARMIARSRFKMNGRLGRCTFTATQRPSFNRARYTCPRLAAAIG